MARWSPAPSARDPILLARMRRRGHVRTTADLPRGALVNGTVRCPGTTPVSTSAHRCGCCAPALAPLTRWQIERRGDRYFVGGKLEPEPLLASPENVVIVGMGPAGGPCRRHTPPRGLRRPHRDYQPRDRAALRQPNLSKDYLAGHAPAEYCRCTRAVLRRAAHRVEARRRRLVVDTSRSTSRSNPTNACRSMRSFSPQERSRGCCLYRTSRSTTCAPGATRSGSSSSRPPPSAPS
jgi:hypothetical protein